MSAVKGTIFEPSASNFQQSLLRRKKRLECGLEGAKERTRSRIMAEIAKIDKMLAAVAAQCPAEAGEDQPVRMSAELADLYLTIYQNCNRMDEEESKITYKGLEKIGREPARERGKLSDFVTDDPKDDLDRLCNRVFRYKLKSEREKKERRPRKPGVSQLIVRDFMLHDFTVPGVDKRRLFVAIHKIFNREYLLHSVTDDVVLLSVIEKLIYDGVLQAEYAGPDGPLPVDKAAIVAQLRPILTKYVTLPDGRHRVTKRVSRPRGRRRGAAECEETDIYSPEHE